MHSEAFSVASAAKAQPFEHLSEIVRQAAQDVKAPASLREAMQNRFEPATSPGAQRSRLNRRTLLAGTGGALAAGLAAFAILPRMQDTDPVETFISDFETFLLKDRTVDVTETDMVQLAGWYGNKLPFSLPPVSSQEGHVKLVGGRLCWLLHRRLASLSYETKQGPIVLYIMNAKGIDIPPGKDKPDIGHSVSWHRSSGKTCLIWSSEDLLFVMVGTQEVHNLMSIARTLIS